MADVLSAVAQGVTVSAAHLVGVSALNAFVLREALRRHHPVVAGGVAVLADALFITLGVAGLGALLGRQPALIALASWGGAALLFWHGWRTLRHARSLKVLDAVRAAQATGSAGRVAAAALGLTLLNPHPYLDGVVLFGALAATLESAHRPWFALGALGASAAWYALLAFGGGRFAPLSRSPRAWQRLDVVVGLLMWGFALSLAWSALKGEPSGHAP